MKNNNEKIEGTNRRKFLKLGLLSSVTAVAGSSLVTNLAEEAEEKSSSGEKVRLLTTDGKLVEVDAESINKYPHAHVTNKESRKGIPNKKFVMVIDLARCKNALKCQEACNKHHFVAGDNAWIKVYKMQDTKDTSPYWMPTTCQHCDKPACVTVCPVDATFKRRDGLVLIDNERCIGCRFCMAACPYSTRVFNWDEPDQGEITMNMDMYQHQYKSPEYAGMPSIKGTVDKCDFCPHAVKEGELPRCVAACPNNVFYFGDKYEDTVSNGDEIVRLSELLKDKAGYRLMEDLGTEPSVYYLPPVDRLVDFEDGLENYKEFESVEKPE